MLYPAVLNKMKYVTFMLSQNGLLRLGVYAASCHVARPISVLTINNEVFIPI